MRRVAALVAMMLMFLAGSLLDGPLASATPSAPAGPLRLDLTDMAPRVVTADGPGTLTVTGTVTNTGSTPVTGVVARVQRGDPLATEGQIRDALDGDAPTDAVTPQFVPVADTIAPGQTLPVKLTVPLRGNPQTTLALSTTGVDELLVNVNGSPDGQSRARLAAARMLLPVVSLPAAAGRRAVPDRSPGEPVPFTLLYPIADVPHRLPGVPGEPALLTDDSLAASFAPDGRLGGLVTALAQRAPAGSPARAATCLAIDPDLVETAEAMSQGYRVVGPDGASTPGTGSGVAGQWLAQLRGVARGGCVVALPYADTDLVALEAGGMAGSARSAIVDGRRVLADLLGTPVNTQLTWPAGGTADPATLDLAAQTGGAVVLAGDTVTSGRRTGGAGPVAVDGHPLTALLADPLLTQAARGPAAPSGAVGAAARGAAATADSPAGTDAPLSTQDLIGALAFRAVGRPDGPVLLAPPHRWGVDGVGAAALLTAVDQLVGAGELTARPLPDALGAAPGPAVDVGDPLGDGGALPPAAVATLAAAQHDLVDLRTALVPDSGVGLTPDQLIEPLQLSLLRPATATRRGDPVAAQAAASAVRDRIGAIRDSIRVLEPPSPYSLGTSDAPLPLTVANGLPVTVRVRVEIASTSGLRVAPIEVQQIPPLGRRQVSVNAKATRSGQFTVDAAVRTPGGGLLGPPSRLRVRSTAYGTITVWLTAIAGGLLVVLAARRVWRRIRGEQEHPARDTPPRRRPAPSPPDGGPTRPVPVAAPVPGPDPPRNHPPDLRTGPRRAGGAAPNGRRPPAPAPQDLAARGTRHPVPPDPFKGPGSPR